LSSQVSCDGALLSWRWLNRCLQCEAGNEFLVLLLLARTTFALPVKLSLSQPTSFLTFTLLIPSLIPPGVNEQVAVWCLVASWG